MNRATRLGVALALVVPILSLPTRAAAQLVGAGTLDRGYGVDGTAGPAQLPGGWSMQSPSGIVEQPDGKVLVAGTVLDANDDLRFAVSRYDVSGHPDPTWGTGGIVTTRFGDLALANAIALQSDGKVIVAGAGEPVAGQRGFSFARYNADGQLDTSFNGTGKLTWVGGGDTAYAVAVQPDGKIVAAGWAASGRASTVVRLLPDGTPDTSFNGTGMTTIDTGDDSLAFAVGIQSDGKVLVGGDRGLTDAFVARLTSSGGLDSTFGGGKGYVVTPVDTGYRAIQSLLVQPDGKILAGSGSRSGMSLLRYLPDGTLDATFGEGGIATPAGCPKSLALDASGNIVSCASRTFPSGEVDPSFTFSYAPGSPPFDCPDPDSAGAVIEPDGKIVTTACGLIRLYASPAHVSPWGAAAPNVPEGLTEPIPLSFTAPVVGLSSSTVVAVDLATGKVAPGRLDVAPTTATRWATWTPTAPLAVAGQYELKLTGGIHDAADGMPLRPASVPFETVMQIQNTDMTERWASVRDKSASGGSYQESRTRYSWMIVNFVGPRLTAYGVRGPDGGYAAVYLDGHHRGQASFYSSTLRHHAAVWRVKGLGRGAHQLVMLLKGKKPSRSSNTWVRVDSFRSATGSFQQDAPAVTDRFQTNWHPGSSFGNYDLVQYQTGRKVLPPTFTMRVRGTEFHLYGTRTSSSGKAVVYVDGKRAATVNLYARSTRYQSLLYHPTGLKDSEHVVRVQPAGTRSGRHSTVGIDYLWTP